LAAGGWWEPICVFENRNGILDTIPTWSYSMGNNLVCEMIMWGCLGNDHLQNETFSAIGDGQRKLFLIPNTPVQFLRTVKINSSPLPDSLFAFDFLSGYFSLRHPLTNSETLKIDYTYSPYCDLGVTNWDQPSGSLLFLNTSPPVGIATKEDLRKTKSNSILTNHSLFLLGEEKGAIIIHDAGGRVVKRFPVPDSKKISLLGLKPGIYFVNGKKVIKL
ncbi:MAG: T9SS type A sorting domain-containing protein, partial [candidate division WOR-3 bacterium]